MKIRVFRIADSLQPYGTVKFITEKIGLRCQNGSVQFLIHIHHAARHEVPPTGSGGIHAVQFPIDYLVSGHGLYVFRLDHLQVLLVLSGRHRHGLGRGWKAVEKNGGKGR